MRRGQDALLEELISKGNTVVLNFNQLIDAPGFIDALADDRTNKSIQQLFEVGALKVSPYRPLTNITPTASQYLQESAQKDSFIFSALQLNRNVDDEAELICLMGRAAGNGDLTSIDDYRESALARSNVSLARKCEIVKHLVKLVLRLNLWDLSRNPYKYDDGEHGISLTEVIQLVVDTCLSDDFCTATVKLEAVRGILRTALVDHPEPLSDVRSANQRSNWVDYGATIVDDEIRNNYELILDLCYNYVVEDSIWGISKHFQSFTDHTFVDDFQQRLVRYIREAREDEHLFHSAYRGEEIAPLIQSPRQWKIAKWLVNAAKRNANTCIQALLATGGAPAGIYEDTILTDRRDWRVTKWREFGKQIATFFTYFILFVILNLFVSWGNDYAESFRFPWIIDGVYSLALFIVFAIVAGVLMKFLHRLDEHLLIAQRRLGIGPLELRLCSDNIPASATTGPDGSGLPIPRDLNVVLSPTR